MFDADRPITKAEQDRLNRAVFSKYLARCVLDHQSPESLVIGLHGGWGAGKTSIINLMLEELNSAGANMFDEERPIILNFSPWSYSGQNQLIYSFFRRLSSELRQSPYLEHKKKIIHLLELYVSFFTHKPVPRTLRPKHNFMSRFLRPTRHLEETYGWESGRDLTQIKAELNHLLRQQKHKIIIIIDNISRLLNDEICQIFQIVKSIGDYANTVYLLSYDKQQVLHATQSVFGNEGKQLLEKVIQLPFEVPTISKQDLDHLLLDRLKQILRIVPEERWDTNYWADVYYASFKYFFENCRDITRYVNTLSFSYLRVKDLVNPVDFFALTAIEVFAPDVYNGIRDNKDLFTDLMNNVYRLDDEKLKKERIRCDEIIQRSHRVPHDALLKLMMHLFPRLHRIYQRYSTFFHSDELARKHHRICSPDVFDVYFRLSMPTGVIPESEMNAIMSLVNDEENFSHALLRLNQDDRIDKFLGVLDSDALPLVQKKDSGKVINVLLDCGDLFPEGESSALSFNNPMRIHRVIHQLLRRFESSKERFELLQTAYLNANKSLFILVNETIAQEQEHRENEDTYLPMEHRDLTTDQLFALQKLTVIKIETWARNGRLAEHPKLLALLNAWMAWGEEQNCIEFVEDLVKTDTGMLAFLCAVLEEPIKQTMMNLEKNPAWRDYIKVVETFMPIALIETHARSMFEDLSFERLHEREQLALLLFLDLIQSHTVKIIPRTSPSDES